MAGESRGLTIRGEHAWSYISPEDLQAVAQRGAEAAVATYIENARNAVAAEERRLVGSMAETAVIAKAGRPGLDDQEAVQDAKRHQEDAAGFVSSCLAAFEGVA